MCNNLQPIDDESAVVYKIVARKKKGTRYYSIAMGFAYPKIAGRIPEVKVQHPLGFYFDNDILDKDSNGYEARMLGRTAGFVKREDAEYRTIRIASDIPNCDILTVKAKLTDGLMSGDYGHASVIAGRHIEWLE